LALLSVDIVVPKNLAVQDCKATHISVADPGRKFWLHDHVVIQVDAIIHVLVASCLDLAAVVIERGLVPVAQRTPISEYTISNLAIGVVWASCEEKQAICAKIKGRHVAPFAAQQALFSNL